jgi:hypothetical protein
MKIDLENLHEEQEIYTLELPNIEDSKILSIAFNQKILSPKI